jgi:hypothetical protein
LRRNTFDFVQPVGKIVLTILSEDLSKQRGYPRTQIRRAMSVARDAERRRHPIPSNRPGANVELLPSCLGLPPRVKSIRNSDKENEGSSPHTS